MVNCKKYNLKITNSKIVNNKLVLWLSKNCKLPTGYCKSVKVTMLPCCESDSVLYGIKFIYENYDTPGKATLIIINQNTGEVTDIGYTDTYINSIAYDKCTKTLYGIAYDFYQGNFYNFRLVKIDKSTAKVTTIGPTGFKPEQFTINNLGQIYGFSSNFSSTYMTIDKTTGRASKLEMSSIIATIETSSIYSIKDNELLLFVSSNEDRARRSDVGIYKYKDDTIQFLQPYNGDNGDFKPCTNNYYGIFRGAETPQNDNVIAIIDLVTGNQSMLTLTGLKEIENIGSLTFV